MKSDELEAARALAERGDYDRSYILCDRGLKENPSDIQWLTVMCYIMLQTEKTTIAYSLAKRVTELAPRDYTAWLNLGMACRDLRMDQDAVRFGRRALKYAKGKEETAMACVNIASSLIDMGEWDEGEKFCHRAIENNPDGIKGKSNLSFCQLAKRNWAEGWKNYRHILGHEWRPRHQYGNEPEWDGKGRGNIVIYGEQGLGDQIAFASVLPDLKEWADKNDSRIVLDVSNRLTNLFKRSFPGIRVYGTQGKQELYWDKEDRKVDYSLPIGQLGEYFRNSDEDFPGTPYLKPDPDRVLQWKALFASKKKPVIGVAWSSGIPITGSKWRKVGLEELLPVFNSVDAHWVSLQYKPAQKEIDKFRKDHDVDLVEYAHGTLSGDYDDTVAMIAAMDACVIVHTTAGHVAGGLGVPCYTMVPKNSQWRYGNGEEYVWADSMKLYRQTENGNWGDVIERVKGDLSVRFPRVSETAAKASPDRAIRGNGAKVRKTGKRNNRQAGDKHAPGLRVRKQSKPNGNAEAQQGL